MTLLVALANKDMAILIADRRISKGGVILDDEYNKLCVLFCDDAKLAVAFTGLATVGTFNMSNWLSKTLFDISSASQEISEILVELKTRIQAHILTLPVKDKRLSILFTGFVYWSDVPEPRVYVLSNFEQTGVAQDQFSLRAISINGNDSQIVELAGDASGVPHKTIQSLRSLLIKNLIPNDVLRFAVTHLQKASKLTNSIGEQCNAAILRAPVDTVVTSTYHTAKLSTRAYGANVVISGGGLFEGIQLIGTATLAGPEIQKNSLCWCGSGVSFKHCHMKKFGNIQAKIPMFKKPLPWTVSVTKEHACSAGKLFCVSSSYW